MWQSCNNKAFHGRINDSNEMTLGVPLGGTVLFLPVKQQEAETIYRHPMWLGNIGKNISLWERDG